MAVGRIIVLSALFAQVLSAPSGCIESCNFYQSSYQSHQTSGGYQDHAGLIQGATSLNENDYARPGNWTEHNQYNTNNGHGKVHEERGQYVEGAKRVRYYNKNFTSSYGTGNVGGAVEWDQLSGRRGHDSAHIPSSQHLDSQSVYDQAGATSSVTKESGYNRVHSQQTSSSLSRTGSQSERLEDFGEYGGYSQGSQRVAGSQTSDTSHHVETTPENWSRTDSYRTDGGHGRVYEEEGQYVTGPKKVRYYKKNYTSSYSTSGVPQAVGSTTLDNLHHELQQNLHRHLDDIRKELHQTSNVAHVASAAAARTDSTRSLTQETVGLHSEDLQTAESDAYRQQLTQHRLPSVGSMHHYADQQQRETFADARQYTPYTYPSATAGTYGTESQRAYQSHETYVSRVHPTLQPTHLSHMAPVSPDYLQRPVTAGGYQSSLHNVHSSEHHALDNTRRTIVSDNHQSSAAQNQLLAENVQRVYHPIPDQTAYPGGRGQRTHYEERWSSSSRVDGNLYPDRTAAYGTGHGVERAHYDRDAYNEHLGRYHTGTQGYSSHAHTSGSSYNSGYRTAAGQLVTGSVDHVGHGAADCTEETQQYQHESRYHRKYKRDDHHGFVDEHHRRVAQHDDDDLTQQSQQFDQETQQTQGFGRQTAGDQHLEDLTQQTEQVGQHADEFTQQTSGKLEFGQHTVENQHLEDLTQQTEQVGQHADDFTQQTSGKLEFGQHTVGNQHLEDLTQQTEQVGQHADDFTQQTSGKLKFGQHTVENQHMEDLTQQTEQVEQHADDFTQQTSGNLEFGQHTVGNQHMEDLTQQTEQVGQHANDFTQQTSGKLEFGQHTVGNQHLEDLTQQTEQVGQHADDFTQQTSGNLEFGQHTVGNQHMEDLTQQTEQVGQHADDFTQQTSGKLEFGQHTVGNQHMEDLTQQTEQVGQHADDFTQQTSGKLEFGQHTVGNQHMEDLTQQTEQVGQHADDFTQQTSGNLEFGQHTVGNQHLEDLTQQTMGHGQQREQSWKSSRSIYDDQYSGYPQQNEWDKEFERQLGQISQKTDFDQSFTQHTAHDQHSERVPASKPKPRQRYPVQNANPSHTDVSIDDVSKPVEIKPETEIGDRSRGIVQHGSHAAYPKFNYRSSRIENLQSHGSNGFDNEKENIDRLHWVHKSNDATVGLQWHYTYHPSDLTNVESPHNTYYPRYNPMSQQTEQQKPVDFSQETQNEHTFGQQETQSKQALETSPFESQLDQNSEDIPSKVIPLQYSQISQQTQLDKGSNQDPERAAPELEPRILQAFGGEYIPNLSEDDYNKITPKPGAALPPIIYEDAWDVMEKPRRREMIPSMTNQDPEQAVPKLESRILQAFGGEYIPNLSEDDYSKITPKPGAALPPIIYEDAWDVMEKPRRREMIPSMTNTQSPINKPAMDKVEDANTTEMTETTTQIIETTTNNEASPSFWTRVGNKITSTYDKAKEKAREIFG